MIQDFVDALLRVALAELYMRDVLRLPPIPGHRLTAWCLLEAELYLVGRAPRYLPVALVRS